MDACHTHRSRGTPLERTQIRNASPAGELGERKQTERILVGIDDVVKSRKPSLRAGTLRSFRRRVRKPMIR